MNYSQYIDHTLLKQDATQKDIDNLIKEAIKYNFKTVCINGSWTKYVVDKLKTHKNIGVTTVVGFPLGQMKTEAKVFETKLAIKDGATDIDMVINIGWLKDKKYDLILKEINQIKKTCKKSLLKVIIETALLTENEITQASKIVLKSKADFIKTSTGFSIRGANFNDIKLMSKVIKKNKGIKAAGGIKSIEDLQKMIDLGATRIGTSSSVKLLTNQKNDSNY